MRVHFTVAAALFALIAAGLVVAADPAAAGSTDWKQLSGGSAHTCGVTSAGRLFCWGVDAAGQIGDGADGGTPEHTPVEVAGGRTDWKQVSTGLGHTCAVTTADALFCWGFDANGQIGDGADGNANQLDPVLIPGKWKRVTTGERFTCAVRTSGRLFCWGVDVHEQLGDGIDNNGDQSAPIQVAGNLSTWVDVDAGINHACALKTSGRLFCWGDNTSGRLGTGGPATDVLAPVEVAGGITTWTQVSLGNNHSCARRENGKIFCWGSDNVGQVGNGPGVELNFTTPVEIAEGLNRWKNFTAGSSGGCARTTESQTAVAGVAFCWGSDLDGRLGDGDDDGKPAPAPVLIAPGVTNWKALSGGDGHFCGVRTNGRAFCWGRDSQGQLGDGNDDEADEHVPVQVANHP